MISRVQDQHRSQYYLYLEIGTILALLLVIAAFQLDWSPERNVQVNLKEQEIVEMEEVQQTQQQNEPPPPPKPPAPVEAPNNAVIEQQNIDFDASLNLDEKLDVGESPPPADRPDDTKKREEREREIFVVVEQSPDCGGIESLQKEVEYPTFARQAGIEGRVIVRFVVNEHGEVTNPTVTRGVHKLLDEEALRAVKQLDCAPGKQRGTPVKVQMSMPVVFRLKDGPR